MEHAELKRDQIRAFGKDILNAECPGSMYATIEPLALGSAPRPFGPLSLAAAAVLPRERIHSLATLRTVTLGCKVNQYETEYVRQGLAGIGYRDAAEGEAADLCLVNTCTVTAEGDSKSRQTIRQLARRNPGTRIVVMGCYATRAPDEVAALPAVAEVIVDKRELPDLLGRFGVIDIPTGISRVRRSQPGLRQSARRLFAALQLLHHSASPAARGQPPAGPRARRNPPSGRRRLPRDRADRHPPGALRCRMEPRSGEAGLDPAVALARPDHGRSKATFASGSAASKRPK